MPKSEDQNEVQEAAQITRLKLFLQAEGILYDHKTDAWRQVRAGYHDEPLSWQRVMDRITLKARGALRKSSRQTAAAMNELAAEARASAVRELVLEIDDWQPDDTVWQRWVDAVCQEGHELTSAVMRHWVWMVRRRLLRLPVENHLCPILYGATRAGKSVEVAKLLAPLDPVVSEQTLAQVCDERHFGELSRHYIVYIDEMAGAQKAELDTLKTLITREHTESHTFFSQRRERAPQNASLLGSSNKPVVEIIHDQTSARRFWEVRCRDRLDWDTLETLDRRSLWASVDPFEPSPLAGDTLQQVLTLQHEKLRLRPPSELWVEELGIEPGMEPLPVDVLWESYRSYCSNNGYYSGTKDKLGRWLGAQKGWVKTRKGSKSTRCWLVSKETYNRLTSLKS